MADFIFRYVEARSAIQNRGVTVSQREDCQQHSIMQENQSGYEVNRFPLAEFENISHPSQTTKRNMDLMRKILMDSLES